MNTAENATTSALLEIARPIFRARRLIFAAAIALFFLSVLAVHLRSVYSSEGLFQLVIPTFRKGPLQIAEPTFAEHKKVAAALSDSTRFSEYLAGRQDVSADVIAAAAKQFDGSLGLNPSLEPQFGITRAESKQLVDAGSENSSHLIGVRVKGRARTAADAKTVTELLGDYVRDTAYLTQLREFVLTQDASLRAQRVELGERSISLREEIRIRQNKAEKLSVLAGKHRNLTSATIVGVTDQTVRYLPVGSQQLAVDLTLLELRQELENVEHTLTKVEIYATHYGSLASRLSPTQTGAQLIAEFPPALSIARKTHPLISNSAQSALLILERDALKIRDGYSLSRFVSPPSQSAASSVRWLFVGPALLLASIILGVFFGIMSRWIDENKHELLEANLPRN